MQSTLDTPQTTPQTPTAGLRVALSLEAVAYLVLMVLAGALRLIDLGAVPLDNTQAHEALAALRRVGGASGGSALVPDYPLMAFFNQLLFAVAGSSNAAPRLITALLGTGLVLGPLLWRARLGRVRAILLAGLLAVSPVAMASARLMGGVTWTMALVFIGGWFLLRYFENGQRSDALAVTLIAGALALLTEPTGLVTLLGVGFGLVMAGLAQAEAASAAEKATLRKRLASWPLVEGLVGVLLLTLVVGTGLFTAPGLLAAVGHTLAELGTGLLVERPADTPLAYALLVALRYEFGMVLLALITLAVTWRGGDFMERFFGGWLIWSLLSALIYANPAPDAALWITIPAAGLVASLTARILLPASRGYWYVPPWGVSFHAVVNVVLLVALAINLVTLGRATQQEAQPLGIERIETHHMTSAGKLGAITGQIPETTMQLTVPRLDEEQAGVFRLTVQVVPITGGFQPQLRITDSAGEAVLGPFAFNPAEGNIIQEIDLPGGQDYFFKVSSMTDERVEGTREFMLLTYGPRDEIWGPQLDVPALVLLSRVSPTPLRIQPVIFIPFMLLIMLIAYLLAASLWGGQAAWRGLALGLLLYVVGAGVGLGWQASHTFATDPRELWHRDPPSAKLERLAHTLERLSLQTEGEPHKLSIAVQGQDNTALAWLLRDYEQVRYVSVFGSQMTPQVAIAPAGQPKPALGGDYIGQDFVLGETWDVTSLSWTDALAWLTVRETRLAPVPDEQMMLWVRNDVYGVEQVPGTE